MQNQQRQISAAKGAATSSSTGATDLGREPLRSPRSGDPTCGGGRKAGSSASAFPLKTRLLLPVLLLALCIPPIGPSQLLADRQGVEYHIKADYLYHFARFVDWPAESPGSPLVICILGKSPLAFTNALSHISGRMIRNRRVVITYINRIEELQGCEILYVSNSEKGRLEQILAAVAARPILTISDIRRFAAAGGMIGFVPVGDRVRFEINQRASQRSNLRISAQLLKLATTVAD